MEGGKRGGGGENLLAVVVLNRYVFTLRAVLNAEVDWMCQGGGELETEETA